MNKYIKKPVEVEALQIHGNVSEIKEFIGENGDAYTAGSILDRPHTVVTIHTLEGDMKATDGDYIIKGVKGEFYPCRKDIFEETYELAEGNLPDGMDNKLHHVKWTPVSEQLPDKREWYLAVFKEKDTGYNLVIPRVADYVGSGENKWRIIDEEGLPQEYRDVLECVAWMPLPEPYRAKVEVQKMTREEAIAYGKRVIDLGLNDETQAFCEMAIKALEQEHKWIPVSEKLPEEFVSVLVCYKSQGGMMVQCVTKRIVDFLDGNTRWSGMRGQKPIAWMPLPEPYKAESEGEEWKKNFQM